MTNTTVRYLTTDGAINVVFTPALTSDQRLELLGLAAKFSKRNELCTAIENCSRIWGITVVMELEPSSPLLRPAPFLHPSSVISSRALSAHVG